MINKININSSAGFNQREPSILLALIKGEAAETNNGGIHHHD